MFATPVIYPLSTIDNEKLRFVMSLNPLTGIVEAFKYAMLGEGQFSWAMLAYNFEWLLNRLKFCFHDSAVVRRRSDIQPGTENLYGHRIR